MSPKKMVSCISLSFLYFSLSFFFSPILADPSAVLSNFEGILQKVSQNVIPSKDGANELLKSLNKISPLDFDDLMKNIDCRLEQHEGKQMEFCDKLLSQSGVDIESNAATRSFLLLSDVALKQIKLLAIFAGLKFMKTIAAEFAAAWALGTGSVFLESTAVAMMAGAEALMQGSSLASSGAAVMGTGSTFMASKALASSMAGLGLVAGFIPSPIMSAFNTTLSKDFNITLPFLSVNKTYDFSSTSSPLGGILGNSGALPLTGLFTPVMEAVSRPLSLESVESETLQTGLFTLPTFLTPGMFSLDAELLKVINFTGMNSIIPFLREFEGTSLESTDNPKSRRLLPVVAPIGSTLDIAIQKALNFSLLDNILTTAPSSINASLLDTLNITGFPTLQLLIPLKNTLNTSFSSITMLPGLNKTLNASHLYQYNSLPRPFLSPLNITLGNI